MSTTQEPDDNTPADNEAAEDVTHSVPAMIEHGDDADDDDYDGRGRKPIELDAAIDDLADLFKPRKKAPAPQAPTELTVEPDAPAETGGGLDPARETELLGEIESQRNNYLRALADLKNYQRRTDEQVVKIRANANERLIKNFLPILDDFELSLKAARSAESYEQLVGGVEAVLRKFADTLQREGVEAIPAVGEPFNPDVHEAVMVEEGADVEVETVTEELRKGFTMHGRVIRPSLVKVAKS